jgi:ankyrin repeat protein
MVFALLFPLTAVAQDQTEDFFAAVRKGDVTAVRAFLDKGVNVNSKTRYGATALSFACDRENVEMVKLLIDRGADVNVKDTFYGEVPIGWALSKKNAAIVKLLLDKGATGVERALSTGVQEGDMDLVKVALEKGGLKQETLNYALRRASSGTNKDIVDLLKKSGAAIVEVNVEPEVLKRYVGLYKNEQVGECAIDIKDGKLAGKVGGQNWFTTSAISKNSFAIIEVEATVTFDDAADKVNSFTLKQQGFTFVFKRVEPK